MRPLVLCGLLVIVTAAIACAILGSGDERELRAGLEEAASAGTTERLAAQADVICFNLVAGIALREFGDDAGALRMPAGARCG